MIHPSPDIPTLDALGRRLIDSAYAASSQRNLTSHIKIYISFCEAVASGPFPVTVKLITRYVALISRVSWPRLWYYLESSQQYQTYA